MFVIKTKFILWYFINAYAIQLDSVWKKDNQFKDLITDTCRLDTVNERTLITCASNCLTHENCKSFFFNRGSHSCHHFATRFEADPSRNHTYMAMQPGNVYFYNVAEKDSSISTSSKVACAPRKCEGFTYLPAVNTYYRMAHYSTSNWDNATEQCNKDGGWLASPKDQTTINALESMIHTSMRGFENLKGFLVSAKLNTKHNAFIWPDDNSTVSPSLWHNGQPEYFSKPSTNTECVILVPLYNFTLADYKCNGKGDSIIPLCECK